MTGQVEQAAAELDRILEDTARNGERFWDVELLRLRAIASEQLDAPGDAIAADKSAIDSRPSRRSALNS